MRRTHHGTQATRLGVQRRMAQHASHEACRLVLADVEGDEAEPPIAQCRPRQAQVARKERRPPEPEQHGQHLVVGQARPPKIMPDVLAADPPASQQLTLAAQDVLIENVHEPAARFG